MARMDDDSDSSFSWKNITFTLWQSTYSMMNASPSFLQLTFKYLALYSVIRDLQKMLLQISVTVMEQAIVCSLASGLHIKISMIVCACLTLLQKNWNKKCGQEVRKLIQWSYAIQHYDQVHSNKLVQILLIPPLSLVNTQYAYTLRLDLQTFSSRYEYLNIIVKPPRLFLWFEQQEIGSTGISVGQDFDFTGNWSERSRQ